MKNIISIDIDYFFSCNNRYDTFNKKRIKDFKEFIKYIKEEKNNDTEFHLIVDHHEILNIINKYTYNHKQEIINLYNIDEHSDLSSFYHKDCMDIFKDNSAGLKVCEGSWLNFIYNQRNINLTWIKDKYGISCCDHNNGTDDPFYSFHFKNIYEKYRSINFVNFDIWENFIDNFIELKINLKDSIIVFCTSPDYTDDYTDYYKYIKDFFNIKLIKRAKELSKMDDDERKNNIIIETNLKAFKEKKKC